MTGELSKKLVDKSIEAFIMGLEIYNKPTINYRIEGFSFFICNAWELMLKAKMLDDGKSIYFKDSPDRTLSLENVINQVYPNKTQPLRINLEKLVILRNTSTHFITEDYEVIYAPLFQSNVLSFSEQLLRFHNRDITKHVPQNFLTLSATMEPLTNEQIKLKYSPEVAQRFIFQKNDIETTTELYPSDKFSIAIQHNFYQVKSKEKADFTFKIDRNSTQSVNTITKYKDPSETHKYSFDNLVKEVQVRLQKRQIPFTYKTSSGSKNIFSSYTLGLFIKFYDMKNNEQYSFKHIVGKNETYSYSQQAAEFVISEIKKDPQNIIENLKKANKKR
ncbi:DUF3644 domain-containing protein [Lactococcus lactis]|uniref:DUF3644 domain-containing protein n=1 Tax=Lactococcus lactis TaxID=1358 RepID=UPI000C9F3838|nr:DUF3644 domain-containing protein [Lactococcus lactis]AUS70065.1 DUF3644 domain-containing protein [Lactococcus lactis subsp. lactis]